MEHFINLRELFFYFKEERTAWEYLEKQLWDNKPVCPHCGSTVAYRMAANYKQFTVTTGTVYENTKMPIATWLGAIWLFSNHKKGVSSCQLARDLCITQKSAWFMLHRIREMVKTANDITLETNVSTDETYVKGSAVNRTKKQRKLIADGIRRDDPSVVLGMVQKGGNAVFKVVPNAESDTLEPVINKHIDKLDETILVTDGHNSYVSIGEKYQQHVVINHALGEYAKDGFSTNNAEGAFSWFKKVIFGTYHHVTPYHLQRYCDMFVYRFGTRTMKDPERFNMATMQGKTRLRYADLIQGGKAPKDVHL
jgi:hypothetical protein